MPQPALYTGTLRHRRFRPTRHEFTYRLSMALLDIDRIGEMMAESAFLSHNRWNWASFDDRDHFGDPGVPLRQRLEADAAQAGVSLPAGPIYLLTQLRYFGYCFNPVSFFYCLDRDATPAVMMAEVNNTFGESRNYWLDAGMRQQSTSAQPRYAAAKDLHVSPFLGMDLDYQFEFGPPEEHLRVQMNVLEQGRCLFDATLDMERRPWRAGALLRTLAEFPFVTAKVIAGIHWQALRLYWKKVPVVAHPDPASRWRVWR